MLNLSNLKYQKGSKKKKKRVARGSSSGWGKTAARGHKGQNSRSGGGVRPGFEGGQTPLYRRLPKQNGFKNLVFKKRYVIFNLSSFDRFEGEVNEEVLEKAGLLEKGEKIKVLASGELSKPLNIRAHKFSAAALKKIEAAGGKIRICQAH